MASFPGDIQEYHFKFLFSILRIPPGIHDAVGRPEVHSSEEPQAAFLEADLLPEATSPPAAPYRFLLIKTLSIH